MTDEIVLVATSGRDTRSCGPTHKASLPSGHRMVAAIHGTVCGNMSGRNVTGDEAEEPFRDFHRLPIPWVDPVGVRNAALFRTGDEAGYITGAELTVDEGATL